MVGLDDEEEGDDVGEGAGAVAHAASVQGAIMSIVTVNVDGLGEYSSLPAVRMEQILKQVLSVAPDALLLQEVTMEMCAVVQHRLVGWKVHRRRNVAEERRVCLDGIGICGLGSVSMR